MSCFHNLFSNLKIVWEFYKMFMFQKQCLTFWIFFVFQNVFPFISKKFPLSTLFFFLKKIGISKNCLSLYKFIYFSEKFCFSKNYSFVRRKSHSRLKNHWAAIFNQQIYELQKKWRCSITKGHVFENRLNRIFGNICKLLFCVLAWCSFL